MNDKQILLQDKKLKPVHKDIVDLESNPVVITQDSDQSGISTFKTQKVESDDEVSYRCTHCKIRCFNCFNNICVQCDLKEGNS